MNTVSILTHKIVREHGQEKFSPLACDVRRLVGCELSRSKNVPVFLTRMDVRTLYELWEFTQSSAFVFFETHSFVN